MLTYQGEATLIQGENRFELERCFIQTEGDPGGRIGWFGSYTTTPWQEPDINAENTRIELPDGRSGDVLLYEGRHRFGTRRVPWNGSAATIAARPKVSPTALDNGIRSPRKLLAAVVRRIVLALKRA